MHAGSTDVSMWEQWQAHRRGVVGLHTDAAAQLAQQRTQHAAHLHQLTQLYSRGRSREGAEIMLAVSTGAATLQCICVPGLLSSTCMQACMANVCMWWTEDPTACAVLGPWSLTRDPCRQDGGHVCRVVLPQRLGHVRQPALKDSLQQARGWPGSSTEGRGSGGRAEQARMQRMQPRRQPGMPGGHILSQQLIVLFSNSTARHPPHPACVPNEPLHARHQGSQVLHRLDRPAQLQRLPALQQRAGVLKHLHQHCRQARTGYRVGHQRHKVCDRAGEQSGRVVGSSPDAKQRCAC